jgi:hypothetical protein
METINGLQLEDIKIDQVFDNEGYHRDIELNEFKDKGKGVYSLSVMDIGRSDKTVPEIIEIHYANYAKL